MKEKYTRKLLRFFICILLFISGLIENAQAQMVYLPDTNFRNKLVVLGYGACIVGDSIDSSCPAVANTTSLDVSFVSHDWPYHNLQGIQAFTNITYLDCEGNNFTTLPNLPDSLAYLFCGFSLLTILPALPTSLLYLNCNGPDLTSLPSLPNSLVHLECGSNFISSLPALPNGLRYLYCSANNLSTLPVLPNSLDTLICGSNQLTNLPTLPSSLIFLDCYGNQLTNLPTLPTTLTYLRCHENLLTNLPSLPNSLRILECQSNQITSIPILPSLLEGFNCSNNQLSTLPILPNYLKDFGCDHNQITNLPLLPSSLNRLHISNNQITSLPELPDSLYVFDCSYNPNLNCLPQLKRIVVFYFDSTAITCLPNYGNITTSVPLLSSIPLCNLYNNSGCVFFWNINGKSYFDSNADCHFDSNDLSQRGIDIKLYKNGNLIQQQFTGGEGYFSFDVHDSIGVYSVELDTSNIPFSVLCPAGVNHIDTLTTTDSLFFNNDFSLICKSGFDLGVWSIEGWPFVPAHYAKVNINVGDIANIYGAHCANGDSGRVTIIMNGTVRYVNPAPAALTPTTISGDTITYTIPDFGSVDLFSDFNIIVQTDTFSVSGSQICFSVSIMPIVGDNNPSNNTLTHCFTVRSSFDPNEKEVSPLGDIDINDNKWLTYTIHFQNTGTAPAEHIYITDTLNQNLELSTFQLLAYSHQPLVQILEGGIARFNFPNINLPDSNSNEPLSHGYIQYKVKLKDSTSIGEQIKNTGYIYFDFNAPVVTNTTVNTVVSPVGIRPVENNGLKISVYPNPSKAAFRVNSSQFTIKKVELYNLIGEKLFEKTCDRNSKEETFDVSHFSPGMYFVKVFTEKGSVTLKVVKE